MTNLIGQAVGPYRILAVLGRGGMGVVYRAEDERLGREVALKVLPAEVADDPNRLSRFEREARAAGALNHPNILTVFEVDAHDGQPFMVTELLEGSSLRQVIASGTLTVRKALDYGRQIASGLAAAHDRGITHRDLKPDNLFLNRDGRVTILDFGLAKLTRPDTVEDIGEAATSTLTGTALGTPGYMAPEQVRALPTDHRADIFALGVVLYEMISGQRPFRGDSAADKSAAILREDPRPLSEMRPDVSPAVQRVINRCLEKRADDRFQSVHDLGFALETLAEDRHGEAPTVDAAEAVSLAAASSQLPFEVDEISEPERPVFVARESELERLEGLLKQAIAGNGTVAFVAGEAGSGKTALAGEFTHRMQRQHDDLVVASGVCSAQTGEGDAFAPWRQVLALLTGDVETRVASGAMTAEQGRRLWELAPAVAEAVVESGRDLVDTLLPGAGLLKRAAAAASPDAPWLGSMRALIERKAALPPDAALQQAALLAQYCRIVQAAAGERPLLLVLEDLHWADGGSIALLSALGHEISSARVLVVCTFRPEDVAQSRYGERHPLAPVVNELRRIHGECTVELAQDAQRGFVDALLDSEPNALGSGFREGLHRQTHGHALFTVELLRAMHDRGMLVQDAEGQWVEGADLDWGTLPARVDAVIGERIERLSEELREALTIASVEGADFTAEVLARVRDTETRDTVRLLSRELEKRHRLVTARGIRALAEGRLSLFGFSHVLFQRYLYNGLNEVERAQLHDEVGEVLEALYGDQAAEIAVQLAHHYQEAGRTEKAIQYLGMAGERAKQMVANQEAIAHFRKAIELLTTLPESAERDRQELALQIAIQAPLVAVEGWAGAGVARVVRRAGELAEQAGDDTQHAWVLYMTASLYSCSGRIPEVEGPARRLAKLAESLDDEAFRLLALLMQDYWEVYTGRLEEGRRHLEELLSLYDATRHSWIAHATSIDPGVAASVHLAVALCSMGYLDQGLAQAEKGRTLAIPLDHDFSTCFADWAVFHSHICRHEFQRAFEAGEQILALAVEQGFANWIAWPRAWQGIHLITQGDFDQGVARIAEQLQALRLMGMEFGRASHMGWLAAGHHGAGRVDEALATLDEALEIVESQGDRIFEPEIHLRKGEVLTTTGAEAEAEVCFLKAIAVARGQKARYWELRAATSLARLWQGQGRRTEALELLAPIYDWFTEGLDTAPLLQAKALLEELRTG